MARRALADRKQRPDSVLAADAASGDAAAFAELYERHAAAVYGYCRRVLRSKDQAADATHEAFVNTLERLRNLQRQPIVAPRPYLFKAAHNACVRIATGRRHTDDTDTPPEPKHHGELSETEKIVFTRELQDDVRKANEKLSLRHREVLALRDVEQLRYDQIARIMDLTPNAAAQLAWRARARLRTQLRRQAFDRIVLETLDCERALGLLELAEDPGALSPDEDVWLAKHFVACPRCASNRAVLADVGATYRAWVPAGAVPVLTLALLQKAGEVIGASWGAGAAHAGGAGAAAGAGAVATGATATTAATTAGGGAAAGAGSAAITAGTAAVAAGGGAAASVPTAAVVAAAALAVGGGGAGLTHHALVHDRAALAATPPALVARPLPARAPKLTIRPIVQGTLKPEAAVVVPEAKSPAAPAGDTSSDTAAAAPAPAVVAAPASALPAAPAPIVVPAPSAPAAPAPAAPAAPQAVSPTPPVDAGAIIEVLPGASTDPVEPTGKGGADTTPPIIETPAPVELPAADVPADPPVELPAPAQDAPGHADTHGPSDLPAPAQDAPGHADEPAPVETPAPAPADVPAPVADTPAEVDLPAPAQDAPGHAELPAPAQDAPGHNKAPVDVPAPAADAANQP